MHFSKKAILVLLLVLCAGLTACTALSSDSVPDAKNILDKVDDEFKEALETLLEFGEIDTTDLESIQEEIADITDYTMMTKIGDKGSGPDTLLTKFAFICIPEGLDYKVKEADNEDGEPGTFRMSLNKTDEYNLDFFRISTEYDVASLEDAVQACFGANKLSDSAVTEDLGEVTYGEKTYRHLHIMTGNDSNSEYLVTYYENYEGLGTYVELKVTEGVNGSYTMPIDDPLVEELLCSIAFYE